MKKENKIIQFIKYNNATIIILMLLFAFGAGVLASEEGREAIGKKITNTEGVDNSVLLSTDLDNFNMEYKIEKITEDDKMYYITYSFINLEIVNNAWQYQLNEKIRKVSKKSNKDLGVYLAEEFSEEYQNRTNELNELQNQAQEDGEQKRVEVTEYTGLIGNVLDLTEEAFPGYSAVKKKELPSPNVMTMTSNNKTNKDAEKEARIQKELSKFDADDLTLVYEKYLRENDPDKDEVFGAEDNCPYIFNPRQIDSDKDGLGDKCDLDNMTEFPDFAPTIKSENNNASSTDSSTDVTVVVIDPTEEVDTNKEATSTLKTITETNDDEVENTHTISTTTATTSPDEQYE